MKFSLALTAALFLSALVNAQVNDTSFPDTTRAVGSTPLAPGPEEPTPAKPTVQSNPAPASPAVPTVPSDYEPIATPSYTAPGTGGPGTGTTASASYTSSTATSSTRTTASASYTSSAATSSTRTTTPASYTSSASTSSTSTTAPTSYASFVAPSSTEAIVPSNTISSAASSSAETIAPFDTVLSAPLSSPGQPSTGGATTPASPQSAGPASTDGGGGGATVNFTPSAGSPNTGGATPTRTTSPAAQETCPQTNACVRVAPGDKLNYEPSNFAALNGTLVTFLFPSNSTSNSVTQGLFGNPCVYLAASGGNPAGFDSGLQNGKLFSIRITNDQIPIWFFSKEARFCGQGMVGAINPPDTGPTYNAYLESAKALGPNQKLIPDNGPVLDGVGAQAVGPPSPIPSVSSSSSHLVANGFFVLLATVFGVTLA